MKILTVTGARPQFVKAAVLSRALRQYPDIQEVLLHTGQHYDKNMSDIFFEEMEIPTPVYNLGVAETLHGAMTAKMLAGIEEVCIKEKPDMVLVYGDTNSTLAAALAASKLHIPLAHVEAGLRSFNMKMPEEVNRIVTDRVSNYLFCPTSTAVGNLSNEGFTPAMYNIHNTGDVMYDAALYYYKKTTGTALSALGLEKNNYILATLHRAENTNELANLRSIITALNELHTQCPVVMPLHPRTRNILQNNSIVPVFKIIEPVGYFDMLQLIANTALVVTDSGGLQKEAYFFKKFCVTLREQTEWVELVENGFSALAGGNTNKITDIARAFLQQEFIASSSLYGDGNAGGRIAEILHLI